MMSQLNLPVEKVRPKSRMMSSMTARSLAERALMVASMEAWSPRLYA